MKLSNRNLERTKKTREVTGVKGQRERTIETDHEEIEIMIGIGKAGEDPTGMSLEGIESSYRFVIPFQILPNSLLCLH